MKSNTVALVQARMSSSRLPGKVLMPICEKPMLELLLERLKRSLYLDDIWVVTSVDESDDVLAHFCAERNISCFRGSLTDVLQRYIEAADAAEADTIVRITGDCPLIDPELLDEALMRFKTGYLSNSIKRTYPRGLDFEIFDREVLLEIAKRAKTPEDHEHVTYYLTQHPEEFEIEQYQFNRDVSSLRWTVDTQEDFLLVKNIFEELYKKNSEFSWKDALSLVEKNKSFQSINAHVQQKLV